MTSYLGHKMPGLDVSSIPDFIDMISASGAGLSRPAARSSSPDARTERPQQAQPAPR
jgi:hypothetical protein